MHPIKQFKELFSCKLAPDEKIWAKIQLFDAMSSYKLINF